MSAYLIANYSISNPEGYAEYPPAVAPTLEPFGGEVVVADFSSDAAEGSPAPVSIVVKFPSMQAAKDWYASAAYKEIIALRTDNTEGFLLFADGVS